MNYTYEQIGQLAEQVFSNVSGGRQSPLWGG